MHPATLIAAVLITPPPMELTPAATPAISADAAPVLNEMLDFYAGLQGASTVVMQRMDIPGMGVMESKTAVAVLKPNLFSIQPIEDGSPNPMMGAGGPIVVSDGSTLWQAVPDAELWSESTPPTNLDVEDVPLMQMVGPSSFVLDLMQPGAREAVMEEFSSVELAGTDGTHRLLRFMTDDEMRPAIPIVLTIGPPKAPWVHRLAIQIPAEQQMPGMPPEMGFDFTDWKKLSDADTAAFAYTPDATWKKVDDLMSTLMADMGGMGGGPEGPEGEHAMVGKPAPEFTLQDLEGTDVSLASLRGKTVILDFWATWCGPCRQGLPVLMDIAKDRAADGVVLWAVDLSEPKAKVQSFLEKKGWSLPVLLDTKGAISAKYKVGGIPHTVVIDPEGVIRAVEIGFGGREGTTRTINSAIDEITSSASTGS